MFEWFYVGKLSGLFIVLLTGQGIQYLGEAIIRHVGVEDQQGLTRNSQGKFDTGEDDELLI